MVKITILPEDQFMNKKKRGWLLCTLGTLPIMCSVLQAVVAGVGYLFQFEGPTMEVTMGPTLPAVPGSAVVRKHGSRFGYHLSRSAPVPGCVFPPTTAGLFHLLSVRRQTRFLFFDSVPAVSTLPGNDPHYVFFSHCCRPPGSRLRIGSIRI